MVRIGRELYAWQADHLKTLAREHPEAVVGGAVFHGTDLPPDVVLRDGIPATGGENFDLADHQRQFESEGAAPESRSALRGSCMTADVPALFAGEGKFVYKLYPVGGGIDVNRALGDKHVDPQKGSLQGSLMPGEQEVAIASGQPACQIEGYFVVGPYSETMERHRLGPFQGNPNFHPGAWKSETFVSTGSS